MGFMWFMWFIRGHFLVSKVGVTEVGWEVFYFPVASISISFLTIVPSVFSGAVPEPGVGKATIVGVLWDDELRILGVVAQLAKVLKRLRDVRLFCVIGALLLVEGGLGTEVALNVCIVPSPDTRHVNGERRELLVNVGVGHLVTGESIHL